MGQTIPRRRVSTLAVAVGRELGMSDSELRDLEYAALMHDIGQLSLTEPIPGGARWRYVFGSALTAVCPAP